MDVNIRHLLEKMEQDKAISEVGLWNVSWEVGQFLYDTVLQYKPKVILEVGTSNGFSALWMASAADTYGGKFYTIDSSPKRIPLAKENFKQSGLSNIHFIQGHAPEIFESLPKDLKIDMAFFDGTKRQYIEFYEGLKPFFSKKAFILADNIISHTKSLQSYLDLVRKEHESTLFSLGSGIEFTII